MNISYKKYVDMNKEEWDFNIERIEGTTFTMSYLSIKFNLEYSEYTEANESFIMFYKGEPAGLAVIGIEKNSMQGCQVSWAGRYHTAPFINQCFTYGFQIQLMDKMMEHIENILNDYHVTAVFYAIDPLVNPDQSSYLYNYNYLMDYGFCNDTRLTQMIDLRRKEEELYSDVTSNHRRSIKKGKNYEIEFYDKINITKDKIEIYRDIYEKDAGKVTRNSELYLFYLQFIQDGKAILALAKKDSEYVAALISTCYKNTAYYSSYGELTDKLGRFPVGHRLHWEMLLYMKNRGAQFYEMGSQDYGDGRYYQTTEKEINISKFKRGFGGYTVSAFKGFRKSFT